jgi:hypothetical protein
MFQILDILEIYNFGFGHFSTKDHLKKLKKVNFKIGELQTEFSRRFFA